MFTFANAKPEQFVLHIIRNKTAKISIDHKPNGNC